MMRSPYCLNCKNFDPLTDPPACKAFPGGIPNEILWAEVDHRQPIEGDGGIRFEPIDPSIDFPTIQPYDLDPEVLI